MQAEATAARSLGLLQGASSWHRKLHELSKEGENAAGCKALKLMRSFYEGLIVIHHEGKPGK